MIHVIGRRMFYGVPKSLPSIRGFNIHASTRDWLLAERGGKFFFIDEQPRGHRLFPVGFRNGKRIARTDQAIYIPED